MRLTLGQFEKEWMGKTVRDGQCVALFRQYAQDCFGIPHTGSVPGAYDLWTTYSKNELLQKYFDKVNGEGGELAVGDCAIFKPTDANQYGHIAIVTALHADGMEVIEQDGFKLNGVKPGFWAWTRFVGALHPKDPSEWEK